jgi:hypothetical protein
VEGGGRQSRHNVHEFMGFGWLPFRAYGHEMNWLVTNGNGK